MPSIRSELAHLLDLLRFRLRYSRDIKRSTVDEFHRLYYDSYHFGKTWAATSWMGVPVEKCPTDLWVYQEIMWEQKPDVIVETGTLMGGSALFMATLCDLVGNGRVISIDINEAPQVLPGRRPVPQQIRPNHPRIAYLRGSSTSDAVLEQVKAVIKPDSKVLVVLDSEHQKAHVLKEMNLYAPLVSLGSYLIVEDTNVNGHPVLPDFGSGPREAVDEFLKQTDNFEIDASREVHLMTFNHRGYLKRIQ